MKNNKLSRTYRFLRGVGLNYPEEEYGQISLGKVIKQAYLNTRNIFLLRMMNWSILEPISPRKLRPAILRRLGANVGKDVYIGYDVFVDPNHADLITIEDHAHVDHRCILLCHKRDLSNYFVGDDYAKLGYRKEEIHIGSCTSIGTASMIMPGVTIGEGAIIGAYSLVTKDVPPWTISIGRPSKVVRNIPERSEEKQ